MHLTTRAAVGGLMAVLAVAAAGAAHAAADGAFQGVLLDPEKVVISNVETSATLKERATGKTFSAPVVQGRISLSDLPPGVYDLEVMIPCCMYRTVQQSGIEIAAGATVTLDIPVQFGMNLGTVGDDPIALGADLRALTKNVDGKPPRLKGGRPDLSGLWFIVVDPKTGFGGPPPMQPWAKGLADRLTESLGPNPQNDPGTFCLPSNATPTRTGFPYEFIQGEKKIVQVNEFVTPAQRIIYMDGRAHPGPDTWNPAWYGHSVGHWEGDTLVIDTVGFNEVTPGYGIHTEKLHVVERIRRPTYGRLEITITAEDPDAWTGPFKQVIAAGLAEGQDVQEYVCAEANKTTASWKARP